MIYILQSGFGSSQLQLQIFQSQDLLVFVLMAQDSRVLYTEDCSVVMPQVCRLGFFYVD